MRVRTAVVGAALLVFGLLRLGERGSLLAVLGAVLLLIAGALSLTRCGRNGEGTK